MPPEAVIRLIREALLLAILLSAAPLLTAMVVGFIVSLLQATTQISEQTLSFAPKLLAVFLVLATLGPWMLRECVRFARLMFDTIPMIR